MTLSDLPPLRESLAAHGLLARKSFGQHFLLDLNVTRKIARLAGPLEGGAVIEVGPGPGGLTRALLEAGARVIAIEKDERFRPLLEELAASGGALTLVFADALKADEAALAREHAPGLPIRIVANLPYNVGTPLLIKWLSGPRVWEGMALMFQKEVARRVVARAGEADYGRLSVISQALSRPSIVMDLPARAFTPPPKVDSAVVRFEPLDARPSPEIVTRLEQVTQAAFGQRRKMLRSSLRRIGGEALLERAGLDPQLRAEDVPVEGFLRLAKQLGLPPLYGNG
ncbi:MAG TPA: 16S rRNA (adenine(1518)-N(6)/adenine(1519)-N(6))-dimethyltransferase RsmA [Caulobacteraceae bacterium]